MVYEKKEARWRAWLTEEERLRVAEIDATEHAIKLMKIERQLIANRALQRARYADRIEPKPELTRRERESKRKG